MSIWPMNVERALVKAWSLGFVCLLAAAFSEYALSAVCRFVHIPYGIRTLLVALNPPIILVAGVVLGNIWAWPDIAGHIGRKSVIVVGFAYLIGVLIGSFLLAAI